MSSKLWKSSLWYWLLSMFRRTTPVIPSPTPKDTHTWKITGPCWFPACWKWGGPNNWKLRARAIWPSYIAVWIMSALQKVVARKTEAASSYNTAGPSPTTSLCALGTCAWLQWGLCHDSVYLSVSRVGKQASWGQEMDFTRSHFVGWMEHSRIGKEKFYCYPPRNLWLEPEN